MKKILYLVIGLTAGMVLGNVGAKGDWECLYGECKNDIGNFSILEKEDFFFVGSIGKTKKISQNLSNSKNLQGFILHDNNLGGQYIDMKNKHIVQIKNNKYVAFGVLGVKDNFPCVRLGYAYTLDLSGYQEVKDETCKVLK